MEHIIPINAQRAHPPWVGPLIIGNDGDSSLIHRANGHVPINATTVVLRHASIAIDK